MSGTLDALEPGAAWLAHGPVKHGRKCDIHLLKSEASGRTLALKLYDAETATAATPQIQYRALERCAKASATEPSLRSPYPHIFLPEERAVLMDWVDAPTLQTIMWQALFSPGRRPQLVHEAGAWLRAFHDVSCISNEPFDGGKLLDKLQTRLDQNPSANQLLNNSAPVRGALADFSDKARSVNTEAPHALLHGDFTPTNLLVDSRGIIGIDMWGARHAPVYEDAARLLNYLAVNSPYRFSSSPLHRDGALVSTFARGYGRDIMDVYSPAWTFTLLYQQLRRALVYQNRFLSRKQSFAPRWQLRQSIKLIRQTHSWLEHCSNKI